MRRLNETFTARRPIYIVLAGVWRWRRVGPACLRELWSALAASTVLVVSFLELSQRTDDDHD